MNTILIGYGEIGSSVRHVFGQYHHILVHDPDKGYNAFGSGYDVMLVTIPYSKTFTRTIKKYQKIFIPKSTIVFSTVPIGTCSKIGAVHCPVEGRHPNLSESIRVSDKWLGGHNEIAEMFLEEAMFNIISLKKPEYTEFLKLRSTTVYGLNIEFARYSADVCKKLGLKFEATKDWDAWVNNIYKQLGEPWATRYILDAPKGPKGGHCVTPNAKILQEQYPNKMVKIVSEEK
jgi:hypothetical protein